MQKIIVELKSVYGRELFYPVCDNSKRFAKLAKSKTLLESDLLLIQLCGFKIEIKTPEFKFERFVNV
jgi:hypothetical protein